MTPAQTLKHDLFSLAVTLTPCTLHINIYHWSFIKLTPLFVQGNESHWVIGWVIYNCYYTVALCSSRSIYPWSRISIDWNLLSFGANIETSLRGWEKSGLRLIWTKQNKKQKRLAILYCVCGCVTKVARDVASISTFLLPSSGQNRRRGRSCIVWIQPAVTTRDGDLITLELQMKVIRR